jgi:hypothetical protein
VDLNPLEDAVCERLLSANGCTVTACLPIIMVELYAADEYNKSRLHVGHLVYHRSSPCINISAPTIGVNRGGKAVTASSRHERVEIDEILANGDPKTP